MAYTHSTQLGSVLRTQHATTQDEQKAEAGEGHSIQFEQPLLAVTLIGAGTRIASIRILQPLPHLPQRSPHNDDSSVLDELEATNNMKQARLHFRIGRAGPVGRQGLRRSGSNR